MRVISQSPDPLARMHTMTKRQGKSGTIDVKALLREDEEFLRALVRTALQEVLEGEMTEALGADKGERTAGRQGPRLGPWPDESSALQTLGKQTQPVAIPPQQLDQIAP